MKKIAYFLLCLCFMHSYSQGNTRISDHNNIGWFVYNGTFKLDKKFGLHTEYQLRQDNYVTNKQQGLLRVGLNYQANPKLQLRLGYAWIETYPYGDININRFGKDFTEHRSFQMATITDKIGIVDLSHRFMLEQRWIGVYSNEQLIKEDDYLFMHRLRYMFRIQVPLKGKAIVDNTPYFAIYDEIFAGFGENVRENIFDQNRLGILLGYRFNSNIRVEGGYFNQIVQLGREVNTQNVFQYNNGFILSSVFNFDLSKNSK